MRPFGVGHFWFRDKSCSGCWAMQREQIMRVEVNPRAGRWCVVVGLAAVLGCAEPPPIAEPPPPKVTVQHPEQRELKDFDEYNGWIQAAKTQEVRSRVRGHIVKVNFQDGDLVKEGQLLFELDPRPFQVSIDETLARAKSLQAQQFAAQKAAARNRNLAKTGAVTVQELEQSEADAASYDARIAATMQEAQKFKLDLEFSKVTASITGRISRADDRGQPRQRGRLGSPADQHRLDRSDPGVLQR